MEAQVASANHQLAQFVSLSKATDASGFANLSKAAGVASTTFRNAAASTGMFEVQQLRLNSATDDYIKKLRAQKATFRDIMRQRKVAAAAYKEQLALENMQVRKNPSSSTHNKGVYDVIIPNDVSDDVDTARKRLAFFNHELKSGSHQMVNWGKNTQWAGRQLMVGFTMPIAAFGAAAGVMAYQLDKELTRIAKVIDTTATTSMGIEKELAQVRVDGLKTATEAAKEYGSAATDTLNVQAELAATGKQGAELQKSTLEVMRIARLGEIDNSTAIDATIALQSVFRDTIKTTDDLKDAFNYMNSIENATSLSTADFAAAIPVAASSVKAFGGDVKELGILLTAMKENGIGAAEGANALKATMQRLGRPSKQIQEEFKAITGADIIKLVDNSDGLVEVFENINKVTKDLDPDQQRKAFAGLFGSYQVSKMMALTKGMGELQQGIGQVSKAYEISNQSSEQWAKTAETEVERYKKSISGMWDTAFQSMKIELAELGEPFVVLATQVVKGLNSMLKAFNDLPHGVKVMAALSTGAVALAGGVLMLTGLFANLAGNAGKGIASIANLVLKMKLLDRQTKAGEMVADLAQRSDAHRIDSLQMLTMQIEAQTAAQREANQVMAQAAGLPGMGALAGTGIAGPAMSPGAQAVMNQRQRDAYEQSIRDRYKAQGPSGKVYNRDPDAHNPWMQVSNSHTDYMVMRDLQTEAIEHENELNASRERGKQLEADAEDSRKRRNRLAAQTGTLMAVEGAALATSVIFSNKLVDDAAQVVMFAALAAPAWQALAPVVGTIGKNMLTAASAAKASAVASATGAASTLKMGGAAAALKGGFAGAKAALLGLMGPIGWTVTAVAAVGLTVYKFYRNAEEKQQDMIDAQKRLAQTASDWGDSLGIARKEQEKISMLSLAGENEKTVTQFQKDTDYFTSSDSGKQQVKDFRELDTAQQEAQAVKMMIDVQNQFGVSANRAETMVAALWAEANGTGASEALNKMNEFSATIGSMKTPDLSGMWEGLANAQNEALNNHDADSFWTGSDKENKARIDAAIKNAGQIGDAFNTAFFASDTQSEWTDQITSLTDIAAQQYQNAFDKLSKEPGIADAFQQLGITSGKDLAVGMQKFGFEDQLRGILMPTDFALFDDAIQGADDYETAIIQAAAAATGLGDDIKTIADLQKNVVVAATQMDLGEQKKAAEDAVYLTSHVSANYKDTAMESATVTLNALLFANNLEKGKDYGEALARWTAFINGEVYHAASGSNALASGLGRAKGQAQSLASILAGMSAEKVAEAGKEVIGDFQNEIADNVRDKLESNQQAATDAMDAQHEAATDALNKRLDAESDALDAAWDAKRDGLEKYWDARIKGVEKAIEVEEKAEEKRQKMFDAEVARINALADMQNTKIDFNVALNEGNLDEAAKIQNTALAKEAQSVFEREREKGADKSAARVDKLNDRKDAMGDKKDAAMEALDKRAEAAKAYFDEYRKMEEKSLEDSQKAESEALQQRQEKQKESLDRTLKTFLASTPATKAALQKQVKELGIALDNFGISVLDPMSIKWGNWFKNRMRDGLNNAALESMTAEVWAQFGEKTKNEMLNAWGFKSEKEFFDFINGKPQVGMKGAGKSPVDATPQEAADADSKPTGPPTARKIRHAGGPVSGGVDNRRGVAKNYKGLHPSEVEITARHGEYIMNEDAVKKIGTKRLDAMNAGRGVGGKYGVAGRMGGMMVASIAKGLMKKGQERAKAARQAARATYGSAAASGSGFNGGGYTPGVGGWQRPSVPGYGWGNTHDYQVPTGTPIYAISDGVITDSRAITSGGSPGNGTVTPSGVPYRSYGETIAMRDASGNIWRAAHMSARYVGAGQTVKGGALIGRSGMTGNASGPHIHFDVNGNYNASGYLASRGIGLRKGAEYVKFDNTMANLHRGESVLTKNLTDKMHEGVERFANGEDNDYNVVVNIYDARDPDAVARKVERRLQAKVARRAQTRRVGNR